MDILRIDGLDPQSRQEEFFLVLEGTGTLRLNGEAMTVSKGDFFAKSAGEGL